MATAVSWERRCRHSEWAAALPVVNRLVRLLGIRKLVMPSSDDVSGVGMLTR